MVRVSFIYLMGRKRRRVCDGSRNAGLRTTLNFDSIFKQRPNTPAVITGLDPASMNQRVGKRLA